eukprot:TRINITY_DN782_c0_g1_i10.p1 TRINITY_DN782_c0_g1~~TRINITY_DN782_c0_g1_i10.p1  ORF type:complete len:328 (+),score=52.05 TRINITY_DN782_c0_g1_i10:549-1532(+)
MPGNTCRSLLKWATPVRTTLCLYFIGGALAFPGTTTKARNGLRVAQLSAAWSVRWVFCFSPTPRKLKWGFIASRSEATRALCYEGYQLVERGELERGLRLMKEAACAGNPEAQFQVGNFYSRDNHMADPDACLAWYRRACTWSERAAWALYCKEPDDSPGELQWLQLAAKQGNFKAMSVMARLYKMGCGGVQQDVARSDQIVQELVTSGAEAHHSLAQFYAAVGEEQAAVHWLTRAAEEGLPDAQDDLGNMYYSGLWVEQDGCEAVRLFSLAAVAGCSRAMYNLGKAHASRLRVARDRREAIRWVRLAAANGEPLARKLRLWLASSS